MTIKVSTAMRSIGLLSLLLLFFASCSDDDLNSVDAGFIDNLNFITKDTIFEVSFSSEHIDKVESSSTGQFLFGVYNEPQINKIRGSFVSQLELPTDITYFSSEIEPDSLVTPTIDDVVLYLPYHASDTGVDDDEGYNIYELDSVFGVEVLDGDEFLKYESFDFSVNELETFLNPLDPEDPSLANIYYTNEDYVIKSVLADTVGFSPSADHIITYIDRYAGGKKYDVDTIVLTNNAPRIAIHLDKTFFQESFLDKLKAEGEEPDSDFQSQESFIRYFKGLYVQVTSEDASSIVNLPLTNAYVEMYYTNLITSVSNPAIGYDTIAQTMRFTLGGVKASKYEPIGMAAQTPENLYVQGTAGSESNVELFQFDKDHPSVISPELEDLRAFVNDEDGNSLWLINEASLLFYVNDAYVADESRTDHIDRLFLYKKVKDEFGMSLYNSQLLDYITAASFSSAEGVLTQDETDTESYYYKFRLTDYITNLLEGDNTSNVDNLGLKIYNPGDYPTIDTLVRTTNWNPRGVVLHGGTKDETDDKRTLLRINYSYQNK